MPSYNKCIFIGHLTRDVETKHTTSQMEIAEFGIAVNHKRGDKEEVMFLDCTAFDKTAKTVAQYFAKGKPILVEGRLKLDVWDDKNTGQKRYKHSLVVDRFTFVGGNKDEDEPQAPPQSSRAPSSYPRDRQQRSQPASRDDQFDPPEKAFDDSIPFPSATA
jgi:single-strand DNA-binding protein